jgi:hypothetical protein
MKNFPHQINQLPRLNAALRVVVDLIDAGQNVDDDGVLGDALAESGAYTFRNAGSRSIAQLLAAEHQKPIGSQGTRAAARDLRRFFGLLQFIDRNAAGQCIAAGSARTLLGLNPSADFARVREIWREALLDLALVDHENNTSHPYRILLRLAAEVPNLPKPYSGLSLEAVDDSEKEFARVKQIARRANPNDTMTAIAGEHMARNSVKILPSLALQLGDLVETDSALNVSPTVADALIDPGRARQRSRVIKNLVRRPFAPRERSGKRRRKPTKSGVTLRRYDPDLVGERFNDHEDCLDRFSKLFPSSISKLEGRYDLLLASEKIAMLVEAKTIRGDEDLQARLAVGQLEYYEYFEVEPFYPNHELKLLLLSDSELDQRLMTFLTELDIGVIWVPSDGPFGGSDLGLCHLEQFGIRQ